MAFSLMIRTLLLCFASLTLFTTPFSTADYPCYFNHLISRGANLGSGQALIQGGYSLIMQKDCNLVLYELNTVVWATGTKDKGSDCYLSLEASGNLLIYDGANNVIWETNTSANSPNSILLLQKDRNLALFGGLLWATSTHIDEGTVVISGAEKNKVMELGKSMEVTRDE